MFKLMALVLCVGVSCSPYGERDRDRERYNTRDYAIDDQPFIPRPVTHTFPNRTQCMDLCEVPCSSTNVYMGNQIIEMFNCAKMRPPKTTMLGSIKGNSFYMTLVVLGCITIGVVTLLTLCFCCSYCCRPGVSSRGSSKDALTQEDGEFREYLNESDIGPVRKEREFSRNHRARTAQVV